MTSYCNILQIELRYFHCLLYCVFYASIETKASESQGQTVMLEHHLFNKKDLLQSKKIFEL